MVVMGFYVYSMFIFWWFFISLMACSFRFCLVCVSVMDCTRGLILSLCDLCSPFQEQPNQVNYGNICTGLEVLSFLLTVLQSPAILSSFKPLQRGIAACMTCANTKVLRAVHSLLSRLMSIFPTEPSRWPFPWCLSGWEGTELVTWECSSSGYYSEHFIILLFCVLSPFLLKKKWT